MAAVGVEMVFSVLEAGPDWAWPPLGPLGTGDRPTAVPVEHGCSLVLIGLPPTPVTVPSVSLVGGLRPGAGVSASRR